MTYSVSIKSIFLTQNFKGGAERIERAMRRPSLSISSLLLALALLPACYQLAAVAHYGVDLPFMDDWDTAPSLIKLTSGTLTFGDLFRQSVEHRQFFPNALLVALGWLTSWDVRYAMLVTLLLALIVLFNVYRLGALTLKEFDLWHRRAIFFLASLLIFSPRQYFNWLFGIQIVYYVPVACATTCLLIAHRRWNMGLKFLLCACLATISSFSTANGILCWVVALPSLIWSETSVARVAVKRYLAGAWLVACGLCVIVYFYGYHAPASSPAPGLVLQKPLSALLFFIAFLGAPLAYPLIAATLMGIVICALFAASVLYMIRFRRDKILLSRSIGWLMLGAYSILTAALVTVGRLGFGVEQAITPRYTTFSLFLPVALVYLIPLFIQDMKEKGLLSAHRLALLRRGALLAACGLVILHLLLFVAAPFGMSAHRARLLRGKACLLFLNTIENECAYDIVLPNTERLRHVARAINQLGMLRPPLLQSRRMQDIAATPAEANRVYGSFDTLTLTGEGVAAAAGIASLPHRNNDPADAVVLSYDDANGDAIAFALISTERRGGLFGLIHTEGAAGSWHGSFPARELPSGELTVRAWAFDAQTGRAYQLDGARRLRRDN